MHTETKKISPKLADRLIAEGKPVTVKDVRRGDTFEIVVVSRDRWNIKTAAGGVFDRSDLVLVVTKLTAEDRVRTVLAEFIDAKHPVALAIEPLRVEAVDRAEKNARETVERVRKQLSEAGNDLNVAAPYPDREVRRHERESALRRYYLFGSLTTWRKGGRSGGEPILADVVDEKVEEFVRKAKIAAADQYDLFVVKLCQKIGDCESATIEGSHVWGHSFLTVEKKSGREIWKTQQIINTSKLGTAFNQWPSRIVKSKS
jgi:hypothetical protein